MYNEYFKIIIDFILSAILLITLLPLIVLISILIWFSTKSNIFFIQERPGFKEHSFNLLKFKTMNDACDANGKLLPDSQRITKSGRLIRSLSLDELPQLFNVLKGDMSLIGPRPLLFKYLPLYNKEQRKRHEVRPGITGWAQVNGRNSISWQKKFEYDIYYVDNMSFALDIKIFWLTIYKILKREGVNQSDARPMQPFNGEN
ncbi:MAG: sugar transferase [Cyclobacteriaceae bacterium]|nr:sugar transferase [Cyclobacteriaceae bacterium]